jgi:hypothetical protein
MVKLALYKGKGKIGNAFIRWWTGSIYSHCEIAVGDMCYSSSIMDKGVRSKKIDLYDGKWDLIELPLVKEEDVLSYFSDTDHHSYGWLNLITSQMFNLNRGVDKSQFCSQWCANVMRVPNPLSYSPDSLGKLAIYINEVLSVKT